MQMSHQWLVPANSHTSLLTESHLVSRFHNSTLKQVLPMRDTVSEELTLLH